MWSILFALQDEKTVLVNHNPYGSLIKELITSLKTEI